MLSVYSPDKPYKVYCGPCWWSDKWDGLEFGQTYDSQRTFFAQFRELQLSVPYMNLVVEYPTLINSDYVNHAGYLKNCYLIFNAGSCDNVHYSKILVGLKDSMDCLMAGESELCYEAIDVGKASNVFFSEACENSHNIYFSKNLLGCSNCFGCINLINKNYHIFNKPYSKEEYLKKIQDFRLDLFSNIIKIRQEVEKFWLKFPHKFIHARHNVNATGDYVFQSKNAFSMYQVRFVEDGKFCQFITDKPVKDVYDYTEWGWNAQRIYECVTVGQNVDSIKFSAACWRADCMNIEYSLYALSSSDIFGCVGIRNKQYCILNKQYSKEEFEKLKSRIIEDMNKNPYIDVRGCIYKYGEFFPPELSLYDYNESGAPDYFPLSEKEVVAQGWRWHKPDRSEYKTTISAQDLADSIKEAGEQILNEVIECLKCKNAFKIIRPEFELLRLFGLPLPRKCPECRFRERTDRVNPPRFYHRRCQCAGVSSEEGKYVNQAQHFHANDHCPNEFETSYAPDRPEIIYCESCYQAEVV